MATGKMGLPFQNRQMARSKAPALMPVRRQPTPVIGPQAMAIMVAQQEGGAGLLADETLRNFQKEYAHRVRLHGRNALPTSYELMDAYFEYRRGMLGFFMLPEKDYIFSFSDFLDYVTDANAPDADLTHLRGFESSVIYNATSRDAPGELLLETRGTSAYGVRAASLVRRGNYLTVTLCLAEQMPDDVRAKLPKSIERTTFNPLKPGIGKSMRASNVEPLLIPGTDLLTTLAMARFDLQTGQIHSRCLLRDMTGNFIVATDITNTVGFPDMKPDDARFIKMTAELDESDAIWEVAKTMTLLPAYLGARIAFIRSDNKSTALGASSNASARKRRELVSLATRDKVLFRTIAAVEAPPSQRSFDMAGRSYSAPVFKVPVTGFWRVYSDQSRSGHDEEGNPVAGKTWVRSHVRYQGNEAAPIAKIVYIKASLSEARKRLSKYRSDAGVSEGGQSRVQVELPLVSTATAPPASEAPGSGYAKAALDKTVGNKAEQELATGAFVYIMRCHAHTENLFKVGFTDRDPKWRAKELSSTTSAPSPFMVLHAWAVTDGYRAEQSAHAELIDVRLSVNREFFQIGYRELFQRLERALQYWLL